MGIDEVRRRSEAQKARQAREHGDKPYFGNGYNVARFPGVYFRKHGWVAEFRRKRIDASGQFTKLKNFFATEEEAVKAWETCVTAWYSEHPPSARTIARRLKAEAAEAARKEQKVLEAGG